MMHALAREYRKAPTEACSHGTPPARAKRAPVPPSWTPSGTPTKTSSSSRPSRPNRPTRPKTSSLATSTSSEKSPRTRCLVASSFSLRFARAPSATVQTLGARVRVAETVQLVEQRRAHHRRGAKPAQAPSPAG